MAIVKTKASNKRGGLLRALLVVVPLLIFVGSVTAAAVYYNKYKELDKMSIQDFQKRANNKIISEVRKVYDLPKDEEPATVGVVDDKEKLKAQYPFFDVAENGDTFLLYEKAKIALIYRPSTKKIVKQGPLNTQSTVRIKVMGDKSAREAVRKTLADKKVAAEDAGDAKTALTSTIVVDVSGKNGQNAEELAKAINGKVAKLPDGEEAPANTDLLVLVGPAQTP